MQIHEITKKRINEASLGGFVKGAAAIAGGIGKGLAQTAIDKVLPGAADPNAMVGQAASKAGAQGAAANINDPLVKILATTLMKAWKQSLPDAMARAHVTEPGEINQSELKELLLAQIKQILKQDYNTVKIDPDSAGGEGAELGQTAKDTITAAVQKIATYPRPGTGDAKSDQELAAEFSTLAQGIGSLQNIMRFQGVSSSGVKIEYTPDGKLMFNGELYDPKNPTHQAYMANLQAQQKASNVQ